MSVDAVVAALAGLAARSGASAAYPSLAGHFANVVDLGSVKVAIATDGVGTKHLLATRPDHFRGIAIDCAAMNANDLICVGATPVAMVDYLAIADADGAEAYAQAIADGFAYAEEQGCGGIVGGEVAVLPGIIESRPDGVCGLDLAATAIGIVDGAILDGGDIVPGDVVVAVRSSGPHSNGFTALRRLLAAHVPDLDVAPPWGGETWREQVLAPTLLYPRLMRAVGGRASAAANVTGGGITNLARVLPGVGVRIDAYPELPPLFAWTLEHLDAGVAYETFNMGVGFYLVVPPVELDAVLADVAEAGYAAQICGRADADVPPGMIVADVPIAGGGTETLRADRRSIVIA